MVSKSTFRSTDAMRVEKTPTTMIESNGIMMVLLNDDEILQCIAVKQRSRLLGIVHYPQIAQRLG